MHTKTPWTLEASFDGYCDINIMSGDDAVIEWTENIDHKDREKANAEFIVKAVNSHVPLLKALELLLERYVELVACGDCGNWNPETDNEVIAARKAIGGTEK